VSRSLDRRRDVRTVRQFKQDIKEGTLREKMLMELWIKEMKYRGHKISYSDYGIDNSGKFVEVSDSRPDFEVKINGHKELIEVKSNPFDHKQTFKIWDLKTYIEHSASIVLFFGIGHDKKKIDKNTTRWGLIRPKEMEYMLLSKPVQKGDAKWGYKEVVIIYPKEYNNYFKTERLLHLDE